MQSQGSGYPFESSVRSRESGYLVKSSGLSQVEWAESRESGYIVESRVPSRVQCDLPGYLVKCNLPGYLFGCNLPGNLVEIDWSRVEWSI